MHCYIYKSQKQADYYLYLRNEIDHGGASDVPPVLIKLLGELSLVIEFDLKPDRELAQAEVGQVIQDILGQGYYLQMPNKDMRLAEDQFFN
jgi:uncharacterized protein YcgL (UPF0745 family)